MKRGSWELPAHGSGPASNGGNGGERAAKEARKEGTLGAALQLEQKKGGAGTTLQLVLKLLEQLEARVRELENAVFDTAAMSKASPIVEQGQSVLKTYAAVVKGNPKHKHGPPHLHVGMGMLAALAAEAMQSRDAAQRARGLALHALVVAAKDQPLEHVTAWLRSFRIADMHHQPNQDAKTRVVYHMVGEVGLPSTTGLEEREQTLKAVADEEEGVAQWAQTYVILDSDECIPRAGGNLRSIGVQQLVTSMLCSAGGTRWAGKAPRGKLARRVNKLVQGKGEEEDE
ncbi:unnamed protein product [Prorocentrum cordatum]|uniref:Uncharacterized protein n=1 Tax=Prorocentrum cordatum TaxID=2364126 RepID=A0ABN9TWF2_9DINO|nr:unnamed protein product [Polarella glacialis]